jgi:cytochrome d ubiquinol oxidase subunit II
VETFWFCGLVGLLTVYVVLDGFDLGAGIVSLLAARSDEDRRAIARSIGPFWDGNEVWLVAAGGTLFVAFPTLYASALSGFYLPLMIVLWLFILRAVGLEFGHRLADPMWQQFWEKVFAGSSLLLVFFLGVALGNVVRGVSFDADGGFFEPLWTSFLPRENTGVLDGYTVLTGISAVAALTLQGGLWVAWRTTGDLAERAGQIAQAALWVVGALTLLLTAVTMLLQPLVPDHLLAAPVGFVFPVTAVAGLLLVALARAARKPGHAFVGSSIYLIGMMASAAFGLYPYVLPPLGNNAQGLTVANAAAPDAALRLAMWWWIPGMLLATSYTVFVYWKLWRSGSGDEDGY